MGRFVFKLQAVLEQRLHLERQRQCELADVQRTIVELENGLSAAAEALARDGLTLSRGRVDVRLLAAQAQFSSAMRQKMTRLREQLAAAQAAQATAQTALVEASKGRKIMEKLREKQQARWIEEQQKREATAADDVAQRRVVARDTADAP